MLLGRARERGEFNDHRFERAAEDAWAFTKAAPGIRGSAEDDYLCGYALTAGDFDGDARADLAIGVIGEDFEGGGHVNNGALHVLYGSSSGLTTEGEQFHGQSFWGRGATGPPACAVAERPERGG